jgi:hypothetical protein
MSSLISVTGHADMPSRDQCSINIADALVDVKTASPRSKKNPDLPAQAKPFTRMDTEVLRCRNTGVFERRRESCHRLDCDSTQNK